MAPIVLVENEVTVGGRFDHWQDVTGERYQFPNLYRGKVQSGRPFVYYRGVRRAGGARGDAEYFGCGAIGAVYPDPTNDPSGRKSKWKWICDIEDYRPFPAAVPAKQGASYLEDIPRNFWGVAVRDLPQATYDKILAKSLVDDATSVPIAAQLKLPALDTIEPVLGASLLVLRESKKSSSGGQGNSGRRQSRFSAALGKRGEEIVLEHLRHVLTEPELGTLRWVSEANEQPGWDIEYQSSGRLIAVEVKASGGPAFPSVEITANEWAAAVEKGEDYRLYLVADVRSEKPKIQAIQNPAAQPDIEAEPLIWRLVRRPQG